MPTYTDVRVSASIETVNEYGLKHWLKIDLGANLNENESPMDSFLAAKKEVDAMEDVTRGTPVITVEKKEVSTDWVEAINSCTEVKVLEIYKPMIKNDKEAQSVYNKKLNELINGSAQQ